MKAKYIIVDDDKAFITLLKKKLDQFPELEFIESYSDTIEAARGITKHKPDVLFLDMQIDVLDGLEVLEVLENPPKTIVISSTLEFKDEAKSMKVYDYLQKPVASMERLKEAIDKVLA